MSYKIIYYDKYNVLYIYIYTRKYMCIYIYTHTNYIYIYH